MMVKIKEYISRQNLMNMIGNLEVFKRGHK